MDYDKLFTPRKPCFYLVVMDTLKLDSLFRQLSTQHKEAVIKVIRGKKSTTVSNFFDEISAALQFPLYFGENWNAFSDCITDLDWIEGEAYILLISDASSFLQDADSEDFRILIKILSVANEEWQEPNKYIPRNRRITPFHVVFQCPSAELDAVSERLRSIGAEFDIL
jgi:RNAse (barnase) inhibitor barstar